MAEEEFTTPRESVEILTDELADKDGHDPSYAKTRDLAMLSAQVYAGDALTRIGDELAALREAVAAMHEGGEALLRIAERLSSPCVEVTERPAMIGEALSVSCPTCNVDVGEPCQTNGGALTAFHHVERTRKAKER